MQESMLSAGILVKMVIWIAGGFCNGISWLPAHPTLF